MKLKRRGSKDSSAPPTLVERLGGALFSGLSALFLGGMVWGAVLVFTGDWTSGIVAYGPVLAVGIVAAIFGFFLNGNVVGILLAALWEVLIFVSGTRKP